MASAIPIRKCRHGYFDEAVIEEFERIRHRGDSPDPGQHVLAALAETAAGKSLMNTWREPATNIYRNWLLHLASEKSRRRTLS